MQMPSTHKHSQHHTQRRQRAAPRSVCPSSASRPLHAAPSGLALQRPSCHHHNSPSPASSSFPSFLPMSPTPLSCQRLRLAGRRRALPPPLSRVADHTPCRCPPPPPPPPPPLLWHATPPFEAASAKAAAGPSPACAPLKSSMKPRGKTSKMTGRHPRAHLLGSNGGGKRRPRSTGRSSQVRRPPLSLPPSLPCSPCRHK